MKVIIIITEIKQPKIKEVAETLVNRLKRPVHIEKKVANTFEIYLSEDLSKYTIIWPENFFPDLNEISLLHEIAHAVLCEKSHHLFLQSIFKPGTDENILQSLSSVFRIAQDWFVDGYLMALCPNEMKEVISKDFNLCLPTLAMEDNINTDTLLTYGYSLAQAEYYLNKDKSKTVISESIVNISDVFLAVSPQIVDIKNLQKLVNFILSRIGSPYQAKLNNNIQITKNNNDFRGLWELIQEYDTTLAPHTINRPIPNNKYIIGRNDLCPCGSGRKFKKCCLV